MPPTKETETKIVGQYDIGLMTASELQKYIEALREEQERLLQCQSLYHKNQSELLGFLKSVQEKITDRKQVIMQQDSETQEQRRGLDQELSLNDQLNKIKMMKHAEAAEIDRLESFIRIKLTEIQHREEEDSIMKDVFEREREIQNMQYMHELTVVDLEERKLSTMAELSVPTETECEVNVSENIRKIHRMREDLAHSKMDALVDILEGTTDIKDNAFAVYLEKMDIYFKDIYWKNIKTINDLVLTLTKQKSELNKLNLFLIDALKENEEHAVCQRDPPRSPQDSPDSTSGPTETQSLEELQYENYVFTLKLDTLNKELSDLKTKFVSIVRRIYHKADFKTLLLEKKLLSAQNSRQNDSAAQ